MKINTTDKKIIDDLVLIGVNIQDIYTYMSSEGLDSDMIEALQVFFNKEKELYKMLNLTDEKVKKVISYVGSLKNIELIPNSLTIINTDVAGEYYPYYRIMARCKYMTYGRSYNLDANSLDNVRKELADVEVSTTFNTILRKASKMEQKGYSLTADKMRQSAYLSLIDSSTTEERCLDNGYENEKSVNCFLHMVIDLVIEKHKEFLSRTRGANYYTPRESHEIVYKNVTSDRINEIFNPLLTSIAIALRFFKGICSTDPFFLIQMCYIESLTAMCPEDVRKSIYKELNRQIDGFDSEDKDKAFYKKILKDAIIEIEKEIVPSIVQVSVVRK